MNNRPAIEVPPTDAESHIELLRQQNALLFRHSLDAVLLTAPDGRIVAANPAACALFQMTEDQLRAGGRAAVIDPTDPRLPAALEERQRTGRFSGQLRMRRADGTSFPADITTSVFADESGEPRTSMFIRDATERELAALALRESEARFRALADATFEGIAVHQDGLIVDCNQPLAALLGLARDDLIGKSVISFIAPELREHVAQIIAAGSELPYETTVLRPDGTRFDAEILGRAFPHGGRGARVAAIRDITERKRAEQELRESEHRYRDLFENASDLIQVVDRDGRFLYVNRSWRTTLGYENGALPHLSVFDVVHPEHRAACAEMFRRLFAGEQVGPVETIFLTRHGQPVYVEGHVSVRIENGHATSTRAIFRDVTERYRAETALRELQRQTEQAAARFEAVLRAATEYSIIGTDLQGTITVFNVGAERMLGYRAEDVIGKETPALIHDPLEVAERAREIGLPPGFDVFVAAARRGEAETRTWTYVRRDGSRLPVSLTVTAKRDDRDQLTGYIGIARDITREKLVRDVAEDLAGLLAPDEIATCFLRRVGEVLPHHVTAAIILFDADTRTFHAAAAEGPHRDSFTGNSYSIDVLPQPAREQLAERQQPLVLSDTGDAGSLWHSLARALPSIAGARSFAALPLSMRERLVGALVVISEQPNALEPASLGLLRILGHYLAGALHGALTVRQVEAANEQLRWHHKAKSDFVSIVSHEFRTPLTGIQGFSELIRDQDLSPEEVKEFAGDINKDAQRLNRLITDMLDLDRMESGRMTLHRESVDLNAVVSEAAALAAPGAPHHTIRLDLAPLPVVTCDRDKITQVVTNLLSNAIKYSPAGGEVAVSTRPDGDFVHLAIRDQGLGIPPEALDAIFERYSRVETAASRHIQGTGLGLPIVRQIAELHGGLAWAESEPGRGSTFHVRLPLAAPTSPTSPTSAAA